MNKEQMGKEISSIIKNLLQEHVRAYFDSDDTSVTVGIITGAGDLYIDGKLHKFLATYNYRTKDISIMKFDKNDTEITS